MTGHPEHAAAGAIVAATVAASLLAAVFAPARSEARPVFDRDLYAAGWAFSVQFQTAGARPATDDVTRAACRLHIDQDTPPHARETVRTPFLAGCDDATERTDLERTR